MKTIGMIVPTVDNSFFANLAHCVERELAAAGYRTLICDSSNNAEKEKEDISMLIELGTAGVIDVSGLSEVPAELIPADYPVVFVDRLPSGAQNMTWVANDDAQAMQEATAYLLEKGCRNIVLMPGYIAEHQDNPRVLGYQAALKEAGLEFDPSHVVNRKGTGSSEQETEELVMAMMKNGKKVDAIITSSDRAAFGAAKALGKCGYYVPEDVRLISFDNSTYSTMASPSITSIDRNPAELAKKAAEQLIRRISGEACENKVIVPVTLIKRDSTR